MKRKLESNGILQNKSLYSVIFVDLMEWYKIKVFTQYLLLFPLKKYVVLFCLPGSNCDCIWGGRGLGASPDPTEEVW